MSDVITPEDAKRSFNEQHVNDAMSKINNDLKSRYVGEPVVIRYVSMFTNADQKTVNVVLARCRVHWDVKISENLHGDKAWVFSQKS